jgi:ATP-dependent RNA helicase SUPV3L1/SUV3
MPLLLKPAPTRLRLLLWSLAAGHDEFPSAPPPGLVTIPVVDVPDGCYTMSGYRRAGTRAIRIDMLERLADMLRGLDSRGGFEANADMLSITGMTLEQFADLMQGLGYAAEKGEREKVAAVPEAVAPAEPVDPDAPAPNPITEEESVLAPKPDEPEQAEDEGPAMEVFYTFKWAGFAKPRNQNRPQGQRRGKPQGQAAKGKKGKGKPRGDAPKQFTARPPRKEKPIDPDNPFAQALAGLKDKI